MCRYVAVFTRQIYYSMLCEYTLVVDKEKNMLVE